MNKSTSTKGLTLLELLIGGVVLAILFLTVSQFFTFFTKENKGILSKRETSADLDELVQSIWRVARTAESCEKEPAKQGLKCDVNFTSNPAGVKTSIWFFKEEPQPGKTQVAYEWWNGAAWVRKRTYESVDDFVLCDDTDMKVDADCKIEPLKISQQHRDNLLAADPTPADRFYRFQVKSGDATAEGANAVNLTRQSAFFVRNPIPNSALVYVNP